MGYSISHNPIWTGPNALLASDLGKELHPPILSMLHIYMEARLRAIDRYR